MADRLTLVKLIDPLWHQQIISFIEENPEFEILIPYTSLTKYPVGFNKNAAEPFDPDAPRTIFETLIFAISAAGVKAEYGYNQYKQITSYLRTIDILDENIEFPFKIQPKKINIYKNLFTTLLQNNINMNSMRLEDLEIVKQVKGIGITALSLCEQLYGDGLIVPYSDSQWCRGFSKFYNIKKPTKKQILEISNKWTNKK